MTEVGAATHFHTTGVAPGWGPRLLRVAQVGMHVFYRFGGRSGAPDSFSRTPRPSTADDLPTVTLTSLPTAQMGMGGAADGKSAPIQLASAVVISSPDKPATVSGGMGGPLGPVSEPASAPAMHPTKTSSPSSGDAVKSAAGSAATGAAS
jgi:hypothetical protein